MPPAMPNTPAMNEVARIVPPRMANAAAVIGQAVGWAKAQGSAGPRGQNRRCAFAHAASVVQAILPTLRSLPEQPRAAREIDRAHRQDDGARPLAEAVIGHALDD